ncbi:MAG: hypothetical protein RBT62_01170 [Spirochaetia bacterium]|jgi:hypothetical protein|nr:hypothetical protein [Spirochaetia bacterium]
MINKFCYLSFIIGITCIVTIAAEEAEATRVPAWGRMYAAGNVIPGAHIAIERGNEALVLSAAPSLELIVWKPVLPATAPLDLGFQAMGRVALPLRGAGTQLGFGAGGSVHLGLRGLELPLSEYLDRVDLFARLGLGYALTQSDGPGFVGYSYSGFNYFLSERL